MGERHVAQTKIDLRSNLGQEKKNHSGNEIWVLVISLHQEVLKVRRAQKEIVSKHDVILLS